MKPHADTEEISRKADELKRLAQELYYRSEDFPAVNRNAKRILASVEMIRLNVENVS